MGEVASRTGPVVVRTQYDATLGADGRVTAVTYKVFGADGKPIKGRPLEVRYTVKGDSAQRVVVWADSTQNRTLGAVGAVPFSSPAYGMMEVAIMALRRGSMPAGGFSLMGANAAPTLPTVALTTAGGDTIRLPGGVVFHVDRENRMQSFDASSSTQKLMATRGPGGLDIASIAGRMTPLGTLSVRGTTRASLQAQAPGGVIMIDYGRPQVRERTVWGGLLIPFDTIWRLGANEATHFATSRDLDFGGVAVPAGLYTLLLYNAKGGPLLVVNKQVGQWGTVYDPTRDVGRIPLTMSATPEFVEEFTINVRPAGLGRGTLEFAWGPQMATAPFTVK